MALISGHNRKPTLLKVRLIGSCIWCSGGAPTQEGSGSEPSSRAPVEYRLDPILQAIYLLSITCWQWSMIFWTSSAVVHLPWPMVCLEWISCARQRRQAAASSGKQQQRAGDAVGHVAVNLL